MSHDHKYDAPEFTKFCHDCGRAFAEGEFAWASDWNVVDVETGTAHWETRYTCDDCEASE